MNNSTKSLLLFVLAVVALVQGDLFSGEGYKGLEFRGSNWVQVPRAASEFAGKEFSFECWMMVPEVTGLNRPIVSRFNSSVAHPDDTINDFNLQVTPDGLILFFVGGTTDLGFVMFSSNKVEANRWYHVAFTIEYDDITSDFPRAANLYVDNWFNGVVTRDRATAAWYGPGYTRVVLTEEFIAIGMYQNNQNTSSTGQYFVGTIDEARLWKGRRLASEVLNYANRTVNNIRYDTWVLSPDQGGFSSDELVFSYNFNDATGTVVDKSLNKFDATVLGGPLSHMPTYVVGEEKIVTFAYAVGQIPVLINLYGLDDTDLLSTTLSYGIQFEASVLKGELYEFDESNSGTPVLAVPNRPEGIWTPGIGRKIENGDILTTTKVVYIYVPQPGLLTGKFFYSVQNTGGDASDLAEVRLAISCNGDTDVIDACGICNGFDASKDACGVCFGDDSTCSGCDHIPFSGTEYDQCGVCGGDSSSCAGCDNIPNSGTSYDNCGVCGGDDSTCGGCDGMGSHYDECGVCNGDGSECAGCDGVPNSGEVYDVCGVCNGDGSSCSGCDGTGLNWVYDNCGVCGGDDSTCTGCDGVLHSGYVYDLCGDCGGNNGACVGCDGSGGGEYDVCGVCRGDGSTCGGCDELGGQYDICGVCAGDNSTCTCVKYHGYEVEELEYTLLQWNIQHTIRDIDYILANLDESLTLLQDYTGDLDLASVVLYFNDFLDTNLKDYEQSVDDFTKELDISLGVLWDGVPINPPGPIDYNAHY